MSQQGRRKHIPQRTCIVCRSALDKRQLTRLVYDSVEGLVIDATGKRKGRGAYLCQTPACWQQAAASSVLERALRVRISEDEKSGLVEFRPDM
ncbi:RNase P modulator RnpM [Chloroflexota bacterium]